MNALRIGVTYDDFKRLTPKKLVYFNEAYIQKKIEQDEEKWIVGQYNMKAFSVVVENTISGIFGKKSKSEYFDEPIMKKIYKESLLTEEEKEKIEMEKEIKAMEQWIVHDISKGLAETKI